MSFLLIEKLTLEYHTKRIRIKILVTGSRGKSTVTRYISSVLNEAGHKSVCKITGVIPTIIFPDGSSEEIARKGPARITEQFKIIRKASKSGADALVLECMSINPELQMAETMVFKPDLIVLTNIREDHMEEIGPDERVRIEKVCSAFPSKSRLLLTESARSEILEKYCGINKVELIGANELPEGSLDMRENLYIENYMLARKAVSFYKATDQNFIDGIAKVDEYKLKDKHEFKIGGHSIIFYNLFSLNDVTSADIFMSQLELNSAPARDLIIILNTRQDRPLRSISFAKWISKLSDVKKIIVAGDHEKRTVSELKKYPGCKDKIITWKGGEVKEARKSIEHLISADTLLIGIGNIAGNGLLIEKSLVEEN